MNANVAVYLVRGLISQLSLAWAGARPMAGGRSARRFPRENLCAIQIQKDAALSTSFRQCCVGEQQSADVDSGYAGSTHVWRLLLSELLEWANMASPVLGR